MRSSPTHTIKSGTLGAVYVSALAPQRDRPDPWGRTTLFAVIVGSIPTSTCIVSCLFGAGQSPTRGRDVAGC